MKISVDGKDVFSLSEVQKKVIKNDIEDELFDDDMKRRLEYVLKHKYEQCMTRLRQEWIPKLKQKGIVNVPMDDDDFANLIFQQPEYESRSQREARRNNSL